MAMVAAREVVQVPGGCEGNGGKLREEDWRSRRKKNSKLTGGKLNKEEDEIRQVDSDIGQSGRNNGKGRRVSVTRDPAMVQSVCYTLAAYLALHYNWAHVIALGAFLWAAATFFVGFSSTFLQVLPFTLLCALTCLWKLNMSLCISSFCFQFILDS
ncbi:hypothetical protein POM88_011020 [Heracleum sosnowskyi]|uniref:Uncharacterized protein n=1 Tax=Heracleum sosnowskyi TaxID=360622 RepID=A0AAD8IVH8_9APIA|nr:hypothetical protein POM88_011020 [Heracleum sosnowskyi]